MKITKESPRYREKTSDLNKGQQPSMLVLGITHQETGLLLSPTAWLQITSSEPQFFIHKMKIKVSTS